MPGIEAAGVVDVSQAEATVDVLSGHSNVHAPHEYAELQRRLAAAHGEDIGA